MGWQCRRRGSVWGEACRPLVLVEAVGQTNTILDFLCVCHKVTILGRAISVAESPVRPAGSLSRGQPKWLLSNSYKGFGLSDSLRPEHQSARGPSALSLSGFGCLPVVADPSNAGVLESVGSADCEPEARIAGRLLGNAKVASGRVTLSFACARERSSRQCGLVHCWSSSRRQWSTAPWKLQVRTVRHPARPYLGAWYVRKALPVRRRSRRAGRETRIAGMPERLPDPPLTDARCGDNDAASGNIAVRPSHGEVRGLMRGARL